MINWTHFFVPFFVTSIFKKFSVFFCIFSYQRENFFRAIIGAWTLSLRCFFFRLQHSLILQAMLDALLSIWNDFRYFFLLLLSFAHLFRSTNCNLTVNTFILYEHFFFAITIFESKSFFFCINAAVRRANKKHKTIENVKFHFPLLLCLITIIWCSIYLYLKILFIYNRHCWFIL